MIDLDNTTILLYPGDHVVDNRPGWIPMDAANFRLEMEPHHQILVHGI